MIERFGKLIATAACCMAVVVLAGGIAVAADEIGFRQMFDGKSLQGWDGDPKFWRVENGSITGQTTKDNPASYNTFLIWRGGKPADFELKAEFRMPDPGFANSGIQIRSWEGPKWQVFGYQPDMDWQNQYTGICYGENYRGILAERGQKVLIGKDHQAKVLEKFADAGKTGQSYQDSTTGTNMTSSPRGTISRRKSTGT